MVFRPLGWLYGWGLPGLRTADDLPSNQIDVGLVRWLTATGVGVGVAGAVVLLIDGGGHH